MPPRGGAKSEMKLLKHEDHFRNFSRSLQFLRKSEDGTDLRFNCTDARSKKPKTLMAHKAIFGPHSQLLRELFDIAKAEMPGQLVVITLDDTDATTVEKLLEYVYLGQTTVNKAQKAALEVLCRNICLNLKMHEAPPESDSANEVVQQSPKKLVASTKSDGQANERKNTGPSSARKKRHESADSPKKTYSSDGNVSDIDQKLIDRARKDKSVISLEPVEKSADKQVQKYYKNVAANPLFAGSKSSGSQQRPTPQKRRMAEETEKKPESKDSKKMRADDSDGSSSDVDADAVAKRKQEALVGRRSKSASPKPTAAKRATSTSSDRSDSSGKRTKSPVPTKKRIGPRKGAKKVEPPAETEDAPKKRVGRPPKNAKNAREASPAAEAAAAAASKPKTDKPLVDDMYVTEQIESCPDCQAIFLSKRALDNHVKEMHSTADDSDAGGKYLSSSSDKEEKRSPSPPAKKKTAAKIKAERRQSKRSTSSDSHADSDEDAPPRKQVSKKPATPRAERASLGGDADTSIGGGGLRKCRICTETFDKAANLKNHVVNHFKAQLFSKLPSSKPFNCPICQNANRDRITLMRHYAFTHKQILEFCTEDDLNGTGTGDASSSARKSSDSKLKVRVSSKRSKKASTSESDDHSEPKKNERAKSKARDTDDEVEKKTNGLTDKKKGGSEQVKFSDDSDDDFASREASKAVKSFDDLFAGEDASVKEKEQGNGKEITPSQASDDD